MDKACSAEGELLKKSVWLKKWKSRYFRLRGRTLCYYETQKSKLARGEIPLKGARAAPLQLAEPGRNFAMLVQTAKGEEHVLAALSQEDLDRWLEHIRFAVEHGPAQRRPAKAPPPSAAPPSAAPSEAGEQQQQQQQQQEDVSAEELARRRVEEELALQEKQKAEERERRKAYTPPPPPPGATDPLSYLMSVEHEANPLPKTEAPAVAELKAASARERASRPSQAQGAAGNAAAPSMAATKTASEAIEGQGGQDHEHEQEEAQEEARTPVGTELEEQPVAKAADEEEASSRPPVPPRRAPAAPLFAGMASSGGEQSVSGVGLRSAVKKGDLATVEAILAKDASLATFTDNRQESVLHVAALFKHEAICMRLVEAGADPEAKNADGESALDVAPVSLRKRLAERSAKSRGQVQQEQQEQGQGDAP